MKNKYEIRGDVTVIFIKRKDGTVLEAIIDTVDLDVVSAHQNTWVSQYSPLTKSYYVKTSYGSRDERKTVHLHRFLTNATSDTQADHINHNTLDNRKENLRLVSPSENQQNKKNQFDNLNVAWNKKINKWTVQFNVNRVSKFFGIYDEREEAIRVARLARSIHLPFSKEARSHQDHVEIKKRIAAENTSSVKGVAWNKQRKKWVARITFNNERLYLGVFDEKEDAENKIHAKLTELANLERQKAELQK